MLYLIFLKLIPRFGLVLIFLFTLIQAEYSDTSFDFKKTSWIHPTFLSNHIKQKTDLFGSSSLETQLKPILGVNLFLLTTHLFKANELYLFKDKFKNFPVQVCHLKSDDYTDCFRFQNRFFVLGTGLPTYYNRVYSQGTLKQVNFISQLNPALSYSFHETGGWINPQKYDSSLSLTHTHIKEALFAEQWNAKPVTFMNWNQGVFGLNSFHILLRRALTRDLFVSFTNLFNSVSSRKGYEYQEGVYQFYTDVLKRDSSSIVFSATSPSISTLHFRTFLSWFLNRFNSIQGYWEFSKNRSNIATLNSDTTTISSVVQAQENLISQKFESQAYGLIWFWRNPMTQFYLQLSRFSFDQSQQAIFHFEVNQNSVDTIRSLNVVTGVLTDSLLRINYDFQVKEREKDLFYRLEGDLVAWNLRQWINSYWRWSFDINYQQAVLFGNYVTAIPMNGQSQEISFQIEKVENEQVFVIEQGNRRREFNTQVSLYKDHGFLQIKSKVNYQVLRYITGRIEHNFGVESSAHFFFSKYWSIQGELAWRPKNPNWKQLYVSNAVLGFYPNPSLRSEKQRSLSFKTQFDIFPLKPKGKQFVYWNLQGTLHFFDIKDVILPSKLPFSFLGDTLKEDRQSFGLVNREKSQYSTFGIGTKLILGNWNLLLDYTALIKSSIFSDSKDIGSDPSLISSLLKGQFFWKKEQVLPRRDYGLKVGIHWETVGQRRAWKTLSKIGQLNDNIGFSQVAILKPYHSINFFTELEIKTFTLYYQIKNLNHDRYFVTQGVHPVGINFRWGIAWRFDG